MARTPPCAPTISTSPPAATTSSRSSSNKAVAAPSSVPTADRSNARCAAGGRARRRTPCHEAKHCRKRSCPSKRSSARPSRRSTRSTRNPGSSGSVTPAEVSARSGIRSTDAAEEEASRADPHELHQSPPSFSAPRLRRSHGFVPISSRIARVMQPEARRAAPCSYIVRSKALPAESMNVTASSSTLTDWASRTAVTLVQHWASSSTQAPASRPSSVTVAPSERVVTEIRSIDPSQAQAPCHASRRRRSAAGAPHHGAGSRPRCRCRTAVPICWHCWNVGHPWRGHGPAERSPSDGGFVCRAVSSRRRRAPAEMPAAGSGLGATDTELSYPGLEGGPLETETSRRTLCTSEHPVRLVERPQNRLALRRLQGVTAGRRNGPRAELRRGYAQGRPAGQDDGALDGGLPLAHVPGPGVPGEGRHGVRRDGLDLLVHPARELLHEVADERRDVLRALPQRRERDREDVQPVVEVVA